MGLIQTATQLFATPKAALPTTRQPLTPDQKRAVIFELLKGFAQLVRQPSANADILSIGRDFLAKLNQYGLSPRDVEAAIATLGDTPTRRTVTNALAAARVLSLPPATAPAASAPTAAATPPARQGVLYPGDVLLELAMSDRSWLVTGSTGTGKSTTARARAALQLGQFSNTQFFYVDLQAEPWLGLEGNPVVSTHLNGIGSEVITPFSNVVANVYELFRQRNAEDQRLIASGIPKPRRHPVVLVINEFNGLCNIGADMTAAEQRDCGFTTAINQIVAIITRGRSLGVSVWLIAQTHRKGDILLSPAIVRNMDILGLGIQRGANGDYSPIEFLAEDRYLISSSARDRLKTALAPAVKQSKSQGQVLALTTQGEPKLALLRKDTLDLANENASSYYQHGSTPELYGGTNW